jgi:hypothetical protein
MRLYLFRDDTTRVRERAIKRYDKSGITQLGSASQSMSVTGSRNADHTDLRNFTAELSSRPQKESSSSTDSEDPATPNLIVRQPVNGGLTSAGRHLSFHGPISDG